MLATPDHSLELLAGSQQTGACTSVVKLFISSLESSKSKTCPFSMIRESVTDLGRGTKPCGRSTSAP